MRRLACALLLSILMLPALAAGDEVHELLRSLREQLAAGRYDAALETARRCAEVDPGNASVWYNLAALEERRGDRSAAIGAFGRAVSLGFDDFRHADADADLGGLAGDPAYAELRAAWATGLATRARTRALDVTADRWSATVALPDRRGGLNPPSAEARLRVGATALEVEVAVDEADLGATPPWQGGSGLLISVVQFEAPGATDGRHAIDVGVGLAEGLPGGAVRIGPHWQRLAELTPKLRRDPATGQVRISAVVPWTVCDGIHPLIDRSFGVNLVYRRNGGGAEPGRAAWIGDPGIGRRDRVWRRGVPVRVSWPATAGPVVRGRPADRVVRTGRLDLSPLAIIAADSAPVSARLVLRDRSGEVRRQDTWTIAGGPGLRARSGSLDVADLPPGPARLGISLGDDSDGAPATWETGLVILPSGWERSAADRIAQAPASEQASLRVRLDAIAAELASRHPLDDPGALGTTTAELEGLLDRVAATGSSVPDGGPYLAMMPAESGRPDLRVSLAIPAGWRRGDETRVALVLARAPGAEEMAAVMAPRVLAEKIRKTGREIVPTILAVPHLSARHDPAGARELGRQLVAWLRGFLDCGPIHVAGVDLLGATALELGTAHSADVAAVLVVSGMNFAPYPGDTAADLATRVAGVRADLPVGWIWFPDEVTGDDQGAALRAALTAGGHDLSPARTVPGGLTFNQAWTRVLLWAAGFDL